jgi:hypothetical protein
MNLLQCVLWVTSSNLLLLLLLLLLMVVLITQAEIKTSNEATALSIAAFNWPSV